MSNERSVSRSTFELHISRDDDKYSFLLNDPSKSTSLLHQDVSIPSGVREEILQELDNLVSNIGLLRGIDRTVNLEKVNIDKKINTAEMTIKLGSLIFARMIPSNMRSYLHCADYEEMILSTNDVEIPWELAYDGENFLCLKYALGRKVQTRVPFKEVKRSEREKPAALFISDPTGELPDAEKEVSSIVQHITNLELLDVDYLKQEEANISNLLKKLDDCAYDIFHYAGHVEFNTKKPEESILRFHDGPVTAAYLFEQMEGKTPKFVFMNACGSARTTDIEYLENQGKLTGLASAFLSSGVNAYIGTLWPVHDEVAKEFSINFYKRILRGESIGSSLKDAKRDIFKQYGNRTNTWASFILYGEPGLTLYVLPKVEGTKTKRVLEKKKTEIDLEVVRNISPERKRIENKILLCLGDLIDVALELKNNSDREIKGIMLEDPKISGFQFVSGENSWSGNLRGHQLLKLCYTLKAMKEGEYQLFPIRLSYQDKDGRVKDVNQMVYSPGLFVEIPIPPNVTISRRLLPGFIEARKEFKIIFRFENGTNTIARNIMLSVECPNKLRLIEGERKILINLEGYQSAEYAFIFEALEDGFVEFPGQKISYKGINEQTYFCDLEPLRIQIHVNFTPEMVGRSKELKRLNEILKRSIEGKGQIVLIAGEAGIGKSRLVGEFLKKGEAQGFLTAHGRCAHFHEGIPFLPFTEILRSLFGIATEDSDEIKAKKIKLAVSKLGLDFEHLVKMTSPFLTFGFDSSKKPELYSDHRIDPREEREKFFFAFHSLLKSFGRVQPLILYLEEIHWSDSGTLDLLHFLSSRLDNMPIMIIGTYRSDEVRKLEDGKVHPVLHTIRQIAKESSFNELKIGSLEETDTFSMINSIFPVSDFPAQFKKVLYEEAEGNPLFLVEVLRSLVESGIISKQNDHWGLTVKEVAKIGIPHTLEKVIQGRLERLKEGEKEELEKASIIGKEFAFELLKELTGKREDDLITYLESYINFNLIKEIESREEKFGFTHGKIQEVVYNEIQGLKRRRLHNKLAIILEMIYKNNIDEILSLLAHHYYQGGNKAKALDYLIKSGIKNRKAFASKEALKELELAAQVWKEVAEDQKTERQKMNILIETGNIYKNVGDYDEAKKKYEECLHLAYKSNDLLCQAWAIDNLTDILFDKGNYEEAETGYIKCKEIAENLKDEELLVEILADLGELYYRMSVSSMGLHLEEKSKTQRRKAQDYLNKVVDLASNISDFESLRRAYNFLGIIDATIGNYKEALSTYENCLEISLKYGLSKYVYNSLGELHRKLGQLDRAMEFYKKFLEYSLEAGLKKEEIIAYNNMGIVFAEEGQYEKAMEYFDKSLALNQTVEYKNCEIETYIMKGEVLRKKGELENAIEMFKQSLRTKGAFNETDDIPEIIKKTALELYGRGEFRKASSFFKEYLEIKPQANNAEEIKSLILKCSGHS